MRSIEHELIIMMKHFSLETAINRVKKNHLHRLDFIIDDIAEKLIKQNKGLNYEI